MSVKSIDTHVKSHTEEFANIFKQSIQQCAYYTAFKSNRLYNIKTL